MSFVNAPSAAHRGPRIDSGKRKELMSQNSGPPSIQEWCEKLGITATDDEKMAMLMGVKAKSFEKKDLLTADEFKTIADGVLQKAAV